MPLLWHRPMHMTAKLSADFLELTLPFLPHRLPKNRKLPLSRSSAKVVISRPVTFPNSPSVQTPKFQNQPYHHPSGFRYSAAPTRSPKILFSNRRLRKNLLHNIIEAYPGPRHSLLLEGFGGRPSYLNIRSRCLVSRLFDFQAFQKPKAFSSTRRLVEGDVVSEYT